MVFSTTGPLGKEVRLLLKNAGYARPTRLQKQVIPAILQGRDVIIETRYGKGKTATFLLPIILTVTPDEPGMKALVVTSSVESVQKITRQFQKFTPDEGGKRKRQLNIVALGTPGGIRQEVGLLSRQPDVVIGTGERIIDHLRRDNLSLDSARMIVLNSPEDDDDGIFAGDALFILSKAPRKRQLLFYVPDIASCTPEIQSQLRRPIQIQQAERTTTRHHYFGLTDEEKNPRLLADILKARRISAPLIITATETRVRNLTRTLYKQGIPVRAVTGETPIPQRNHIFARFDSGNLSAVVAPKSYRPVGANRALKTIFYYDFPREPGDYLAQFEGDDEYDTIQDVYSFVRERELPTLEQVEEIKSVSMKKETLPTREEVLKGTIEGMLRMIREDEDPEELKRYRSIYRKHVPLFLRSYFTAFLLKNSSGQDSPAAQKPEFTTLFISIGRNRRVFPKDLSQLFLSRVNIRKAELGEVKVLDNYSFVDVPREKADKAIAELNGFDFRGRKITVNYARKRENNGTTNG